MWTPASTELSRVVQTKVLSQFKPRMVLKFFASML